MHRGKRAEITAHQFLQPRLAPAALGDLGFKPAEASAAVAAAQDELGPDVALDALVRLALRKPAQ